MADGITVKIGTDSTGVNTGLSALSKSFGKLRGDISQIRATSESTITTMARLNGAFSFVGKLLAPLGSLKESLLGAFDLAGTAEQTKTAFNVLIGDTKKATATLAELKKLADTSPYGDQEINDAAKSLLAFGINAEDVTKNLAMIGDIASGVNAPIGEIAELFGKAKVQGTLFAEDINQLTGRGIPVIQEFARSLGVGTDKVKKLGSEGKINFALLDTAFQNLTGNGGKFNGMMNQQSQTFNGLKSTLMAGWDALKVAFATPIMESLKPLLQFVTDRIGSIKEAAAATGKSIADWATYLQGAFGTGNGMEALIMPLKIGLLDAANSFAIKMQEAIDKVSNKLDSMKAWNPTKMFSSGMDKEKMDAMFAGQPQAGPKVGPYTPEINAARARLAQIQAQSANFVAVEQMKKAAANQSAPSKAFLDSLTEATIPTGLEKKFQVAPTQTQSQKNEEYNAKLKAEEAERKKAEADSMKIRFQAVSDSISKIGGGGYVGTRGGTLEERIARAVEDSAKKQAEQLAVQKQIRDKKAIYE